jgi:hypothetical protein
MIEVQPAPALRRAFARWATAQTPKVRTVSPADFAVPAALFVAAPEEVLIGALIDGHRYISPQEDAENGTPPPGDAPQADVAAMVAAIPPADVAADNADDLSESELPAGEPGPPDGDQPEGVFPCRSCEREFTTARGRDIHARQVHATSGE